MLRSAFLFLLLEQGGYDDHVLVCFACLFFFMQIEQFTSSLEAGFAARTDRRTDAYPTQRPNAKMGAGDKGEDKDEKVKDLIVIAPRRAQNLSIAMKKMGRVLSVSEVATAITVANLEVLTEEKVDLLQLMELEPDEDASLRQAASANQRARLAEEEKHRQEEEEAMRASEAPDAATGEVAPRASTSDPTTSPPPPPAPVQLRSTVPKFRALEAYLLGLQKVPRLTAKLHALAMRRSADHALAAAASDVRTIAAALVEVCGCASNLDAGLPFLLAFIFIFLIASLDFW